MTNKEFINGVIKDKSMAWVERRCDLGSGALSKISKGERGLTYKTVKSLMQVSSEQIKYDYLSTLIHDIFGVDVNPEVLQIVPLLSTCSKEQVNGILEILGCKKE